MQSEDRDNIWSYPKKDVAIGLFAWFCVVPVLLLVDAVRYFYQRQKSE